MHTRSSLTRGLRPPDPLTRSLAGAPRPAPLAWLARCAHSRLTAMHAHALISHPGTSSPGPPYTLARGGPTPRAARVARSLRSLAPDRDACTRAHLSPGDFVPRTPLHARSRGPHAPRRSRGSLAALTRA